MCHKKRRYASDVDESEWRVLKGLFAKHKGPGRPMELDLRAVVNAIFYVLRTGCAWVYLPSEYPNYNSVYYHYRKWCHDNTWERINAALRGYFRQSRKRQVYPSAAIIDSQSVKTTQAGGERGFDGGKKVNGRKRHLLVDTFGNILKAIVHAANIQDRDGAKLLLSALPQALWSRLQRIWADGGYDGDLTDWLTANFPNVVLDIVSRPQGAKGFVLLPRRWVVERSFAWLGLYRRLNRDYEQLVQNSAGMIYLASIHRLLTALTTMP